VIFLTKNGKYIDDKFGVALKAQKWSWHDYVHIMSMYVYNRPLCADFFNRLKNIELGQLTLVSGVPLPSLTVDLGT
jgi:hypothetical protein